MVSVSEDYLICIILLVVDSIRAHHIEGKMGRREEEKGEGRQEKQNVPLIAAPITGCRLCRPRTRLP